MDWFTKAIFGGKLIEKGKITPVIGVKDATQLNLIDLEGNILQADSRDCSWTPNQIAKLSEKELKVKTYKINLEQCIDDLERKRTVWMLSPGAKNQELPATIKLLGVSLTKANVLAEVEKVFASIPEDVMAMGLENGSLNIYVSYSAYMKVKMALGGIWGDNVVVSPNFAVEGDSVRYMGVEIVPVKGLDDNDMIAADSKNFLVGTDLVRDLEEIRLGQFAAPNDNKIFIAIPFEDEVVFYSPSN